MITPRSNLLWWTGCLLIPLSVLAAVLPAYTAAYIAAAVLICLLPAFDAVMVFNNLNDLKATAEKRTNTTHNANAQLLVHLESEACKGDQLRFGMPMPAELGCVEQDFETLLPKETKNSTLAFEINPQKRGVYKLTQFFAGVKSPMGFWMRKRELEINAEVHVYPDLSMHRRQLGAIFLNRGNVGLHVQRQVGQGREFEKLREYIPGDNYLDIHWKTTAKRGKPITKMYQLERTQEVYLVIDSSRLSGQLPPSYDKNVENKQFPPTMLERFIASSLVMCNVAESQGDLFGILSYSDRVDNFIRSRNGKAHYSVCREALYTLQPKQVSPDFSELFSFIRTRLRKRALLVFMTNLDDPLISETFVKNISLISKHHLVLVNMIRPDRVMPIFSNPEVEDLDDIYREVSGHMQHNRLMSIGNKLNIAGVQFGLVDDESFCPQIVSQYMTVKKRQLL